MGFKGRTEGHCLGISEENSYTNREQGRSGEKQRIMPLFRDIHMIFKPLYDFHGREDHEDEHHNGENKGNNSIHHRL